VPSPCAALGRNSARSRRRVPQWGGGPLTISGSRCRHAAMGALLQRHPIQGRSRGPPAASPAPRSSRVASAPISAWSAARVSSPAVSTQRCNCAASDPESGSAARGRDEPRQRAREQPAGAANRYCRADLASYRHRRIRPIPEKDIEHALGTLVRSERTTFEDHSGARGWRLWAFPRPGEWFRTQSGIPGGSRGPVGGVGVQSLVVVVATVAPAVDPSQQLQGTFGDTTVGLCAAEITDVRRRRDKLKGLRVGRSGRHRGYRGTSQCPGRWVRNSRGTPKQVALNRGARVRSGLRFRLQNRPWGPSNCPPCP
jgi:hypothetical protein